MRMALVSASALVLVAASARAAGPLSATDASFVAGVGQGGMFEVKAGQLGADKGSTQVVRDQAATEAHDHGLVGQKLAAIVSAAGGAVPGTLDAAFSSELASLQALSGPAFDAAYLRDMEQVHAKDGAAFAHEATHGDNPQLKAFALETHAIVEAHVGELKAIPTNGR